MSTTWLLLDSHYLAWRAYYSLRGTILAGGGEERTEVIYGFLRDVVHFQTAHNTGNFVFAFDSLKSKREKLYPQYKANRKKHDAKLTDAERKAVRSVRGQIKTLRRDLLPNLGFQNVFQQTGYEADDIIASLCNSLPVGDKAIIISRDQDFYQLLAENVLIWNPQHKEATTNKSFYKKHGVEPKEWVKVKSIAGCFSDNIQGIKGVGEPTAAKYLRGELKTSSKAYKSIKEGSQVIKRNMKLVKLPYRGTKNFKLKHNKLSHDNWNKIMHSIDMKSLQGKAF